MAQTAAESQLEVTSGISLPPPARVVSWRISVIIIAVAGMISFLVACRIGEYLRPAQPTSNRPPVDSTAALVVDAEHLSFGDVWEDPAFGWVLPIRNMTNEEVEISHFETSCGCGKTEPSSVTIPARGTAEVRLTLNLVTAHREPDLKGEEFKVAVQPRIGKGAGQRAGWVVYGRVKRPFVIDPPVVDFEERLVWGQTFAPRSATITCGLDVAELTARCDSPHLTAKVTRDVNNARQFRLEVQAREDMPSGFFNNLVRLTAGTASKKAVPGAVPVVGRVLEEVGLRPELLAFGAEPIGTNVKETVLLQSRSPHEFAIQEIDTGGVAGLAVDVGQKTKDGTQPLVVSLPVKLLGPQMHTVHVKVKTGKRLLDLSLQLRYHGIPAQTAFMTQ